LRPAEDVVNVLDQPASCGDFLAGQAFTADDVHVGSHLRFAIAGIGVDCPSSLGVGMALKNAFYAQSGGVSAVINASACGVLQTAGKRPPAQPQPRSSTA
jgi:hypothetical protein